MVGANVNGTDGPAPGSSGPTGSRRAKLRRGLAVAVLTVAACTLALELWLRASGSREEAFAGGVNRTNRRWVALLAAGLFEEVPDPVRRYAMRPGARAEVDGWTFRVSSHRTRGEDFPAQKPPGEKRLLCLGDSFAFGLWADEDESLVAHLARMANAAELSLGSGLTWRAINLGVPGYHSGQQLASLAAEGLALDPDAVILYYNTNDIVREGLFLDEELGALRADHLPLPTGLRRRLWRASHLYGLIAQAYTRDFASIESPHLDPRVPWSHVRQDNQEYTARSIRRMAELCAQDGVPLFFVNQPLLTWSGEMRRADWRVLPLVEWAADLRAELELPGIDLLGFLRGYGDGIDRLPGPPDPDFSIEEYIADEAVQRWFAGDASAAMPADPDFHFLGAGYEHIARLCYPRLRAAGILP